MKKLTEKDYQKWIEEIVEKWKPVLFLDIYYIKIEKTTKAGETTYLSIKSNHPYVDALILWTKASFDEWKKQDDPLMREQEIVHELCHIITDPLYFLTHDRYVTKTEVNDQREMLTDKIANIVIKLNR